MATSSSKALTDRRCAGFGCRGADDGRALRGKLVGDRRTDAAAGASDQRNIPIQSRCLRRLVLAHA